MQMLLANRTEEEYFGVKLLTGIWSGSQHNINS